ILFVVVSACVFAYLIAHQSLSIVIISLSGIVLLFYLISLWKSLGKAQKTNIAILIILSIFMLFYWTLSNQTTNSIPVLIKS
ncbi:MFS transporter, partial [Francisella tularensis subsp. holarctica]|nr:MFS transporter [Francisella tularensis subsp. holarctica]